MENLNEILLQYEHDFFSYKFCNCIENLENRFADEFIECGISGMYTRQECIQSLHKISEDRKIDISDFCVQLISCDAALVRYNAYFNNCGTISSRSSIWVKRNNDWKIFYHQATIHNPAV